MPPKKISRQAEHHRKKARDGQHNVSVWLSEESYNRLKGLAGLWGLTMGAMVEQAVASCPMPRTRKVQP